MMCIYVLLRQFSTIHRIKSKLKFYKMNKKKCFALFLFNYLLEFSIVFLYNFNCFNYLLLKFSLFTTFLKASCVRESVNATPVDATKVHMNPITYIFLETFVEFDEDSLWNTRREEEIVRRTKELIMKGVNLSELRK